MRLKLLSAAALALLAQTGWAQKYKSGSVSMYNAKGQKYGNSYHKLQLGVVLPGSLPAKNNSWYTRKSDKVVDGNAALIPLSLRYAWSSNPNTEFVVQGDYERTAYYDEVNQSAITHFRNFYTLCVGMNYKWWQQKNLTLYSGLLLGGGYGKYTIKGTDQSPTYPDDVDKTNCFYPSAQLTAIGATWGRTFGGFAELAFGSKGVFTAGIYWKI